MQTQDHKTTDSRLAAKYRRNPPTVRGFSVALLAAYFAVSLLGPALAAEPRHPPLECYTQMTLIICADGWCSSTFALARSGDEA